MLGYYDTEYDTVRRVRQLADQRAVARAAFHIKDRDGNPNVFKLERNDDGLWLNDNWTNPTDEWNPENEVVFRLRYSFRFSPFFYEWGVFVVRGVPLRKKRRS